MMGLDTIAESLDMIEMPDLYAEQKELAKEAIAAMIAIPESEWAHEDFRIVRNNIITISQMGTVALQQITDLAQANSTPRVYEVLSTFMKTLVEINNNLLDMHAKRAKEESKGPTTQSGDLVTNNNLFVGSSSELLDKLSEMGVSTKTE